MAKKIAVIVGSLRKGSFNQKFSHVLKAVAPSSLALEWVEIGDLPLYNEDLENQAPAQWREFRQKIKAVDALLFVTPEYNRSVPGVLKNAVDVGSRPYTENVWSGKPAAVVSVSPGVLGGFGSNHHLRQSLMCLNIPVMPTPEAYIGSAAQLFNEQGDLIKEETKIFAQKFMDSFAKWIERNSAS